MMIEVPGLHGATVRSLLTMRVWSCPGGTIFSYWWKGGSAPKAAAFLILRCQYEVRRDSGYKVPFLLELRTIQHHLRGIYTGNGDTDAVCQCGAAGSVHGRTLCADAPGDRVCVLPVAVGKGAWGVSWLRPGAGRWEASTPAKAGGAEPRPYGERKGERAAARRDEGIPPYKQD